MNECKAKTSVRFRKTMFRENQSQYFPAPAKWLAGNPLKNQSLGLRDRLSPATFKKACFDNGLPANFKASLETPSKVELKKVALILLSVQSPNLARIFFSC